MKKGKYILVLFIVLLLSGCGAKETIKEVNFDAKYIRTDGSVRETNDTIVEKITSVDQLNAYYDDNKGNYNFSDNSDLSSSFTNEIDKYDEEYFKNSFLLVILVQEEGSDIYHTIKSVDENGNVVIERNLTNHESTDVATWHILVELDNANKDVDYKISMKDIK